MRSPELRPNAAAYRLSGRTEAGGGEEQQRELVEVMT